VHLLPLSGWLRLLSDDSTRSLLLHAAYAVAVQALVLLTAVAFEHAEHMHHTDHEQCSSSRLSIDASSRDRASSHAEHPSSPSGGAATRPRTANEAQADASRQVVTWHSSWTFAPPRLLTDWEQLSTGIVNARVTTHEHFWSVLVAVTVFAMNEHLVETHDVEWCAHRPLKPLSSGPSHRHPRRAAAVGSRQVHHLVLHHVCGSHRDNALRKPLQRQRPRA
jgi:hypothetical protein